MTTNCEKICDDLLIILVPSGGQSPTIITLDTHSFIRWYILHFSLWIWREFNSNEVYEFILFLPSLALILCIIRLLSDEKTFFFFFFGGAGTHPAGTTTTTSTDLELKASISSPSTHNYFAYFYTYICFVLGLLDRLHFKNGFSSGTSKNY